MSHQLSYRSAVVASLAALVLLALMPPTPFARAATPYPDIGHQTAEIQDAIQYASDNGYMNGAADGNFYPDAPVSRIDYARAVVKLFKLVDEQPDPSLEFTDLDEKSDDYKFANIATKHGLLCPYPVGSYRPTEQANTLNVLCGLAKGLGLDFQGRLLNGLYPRGPADEGLMIIAHDLHLRYRNTRAWPSRGYPRGELAYSLKCTDDVEDWRLDYVRESFDWLHCQQPLVGPKRQEAMDAAFSKIGYPYVWGGESDAEGGYDCSGLVYFVLDTTLGYPMQRVADDQARDTRYPAVGRKEFLAGDPIFFYENPTGDTKAYIGHAGMYIGNGMFIHSTGSNAGVSVDLLTGYWGDHLAWGKRVMSEPERESFDTYVLLMNPGQTAANAKLTYMLPSGSSYSNDVTLQPNTRETVKVDDTLVNQEFSTRVDVKSGNVVAERSMYFRYLDKYSGGHDSPGVAAPAQAWYLPEGCTAFGFDTFVLVQNPGPQPARVTLTYMKDDGTTKDQAITVQPASRYTVAVDEVPGMEQAQFSTRVAASKPVIVERSMYFDYKGIKEGHNSPATSELKQEWYFAEGYTGGKFDTYILVMNPNDTRADVTLTLMSPLGEAADVPVALAPHSRKTVSINGIPGWNPKEFSAVVRSNLPVAAERSMYFVYDGKTGGHDAMGCAAPSKTWYLAEGYTGPGFDTYVLLFNPNTVAATANVRYMLNGGRFVDVQYPIPARSRYTIAVNKQPGLENADVSTMVSSDQPLVAERSIYFDYSGRQGGSCGPGVTAPAPEWYFAEGYTGP